MSQTQAVLTESAIVLSLFGLALAGTLVSELPVAGLFRVGRRGLAVVALINLITNPLMNLAFLLVVLTTGVGFGAGWIAAASIPVLEVTVVIVEWRLLVWALNGTAGTSRKMLALSITMNVVSVAGGALATTVLPLLRLP